MTGGGFPVKQAEESWQEIAVMCRQFSIMLVTEDPRHAALQEGVGDFGVEYASLGVKPCVRAVVHLLAIRLEPGQRVPSTLANRGFRTVIVGDGILHV